MAGRGPSRQELIRRRRRSELIGRIEEQTTFQDALRQPPEDATQFLFHIHGPAGVGKSTLVRQLQSIAHDAEALTAVVDESVSDPVEAMRAISFQFAQQGNEFKNFDKLLATYRQRRHEVDSNAAAAGAEASQQGLTEASPSNSSVIASRLGLVGLGMIPGVGPFAGAVDPARVALGADRVKSMLSSRLRSHEDVELVASPLQSLTPLFLQDLGDIAKRRPWLALFFDTYERIGPLLDAWLQSIIVSDQHGQMPANVLVVLAGQSQLDVRCWGDWLDLVTDLPLNIFTEFEARQLLTAKGVTDERIAEVILQVSGRLPVLVSTLAESQPNSVEDVGDPSGTAVERFLKWESDPAHRTVAMACSLPEEVNEDIYFKAVSHEEYGHLFTWLRSLPFVTDHSGQLRYHEVVREAMLRLQRQQSPERWKRQHSHLAEAFQEWRSRIEEDTASTRSLWTDEVWRGYKLQETYHRLCADHRATLPKVLQELLDAYDAKLSILRRYVQTIARAGRDADARPVRDWAKRLQAALADPNPGISILTLLLSHGDLDKSTQSRALIMRAWEYRIVDQVQQSMTDYTTAINLHPTARAFRGLGEVHLLRDELEDALINFNQAVEIEPDSAWSIANRGRTRYAMKQYEEAIGDLNRAIEIDPQHAWALNIRGLTFHAMDRYDDAVADFTRAITSAPELSWSYINRGEAHKSASRYGQAITDFTRAIEIDPERAWAFTNRALTYHSLHQHNAALEDFARSLEIESHPFTLTYRSLVYRKLGRYTEALADLERAITLDPFYTWAITSRGLFYASLARTEEALADLTRAIELEPRTASFLRSRGQIYRLEGRLEEALSDFTCALELEPNDAFSLTNRGVISRLQGRYEDALSDFARAADLDPSDGWSQYEKAVVLHALQDQGREAQIAHVVEMFSTMEPQTLYSRANLFLTHCLTPDWEKAEFFLKAAMDSNPSAGEMSELTTVMDSLTLTVEFPARILETFRGHLRNASPETH
ncbi:tetratricopeptide repeat protein [Streptomyces sp. NPDC093801]|uniref:tetratricopeptide repeat protein n=1 Tax=Streptomyces sp. NPDC093801 TaxID=3155203 RepID=UPI00344F08AC